MHVICRGTANKPVGHISNAGSARLQHPCTVFSGHNLQVFSPEKPKIWAMNIKQTSQEQITPSRTSQQESAAQHVTDFKALRLKSSKASVSQDDTWTHTASVHPGSSSLKSSDASHSEIQRIRIVKRDERLTSDGSSRLQKRLQKRLSLKTALSADNDVDGRLTKRLPPLSGEATESINRPQYQLKATKGDNKGDSTKIAALWIYEVEPSHIYCVEKGNQKGLAYVLSRDSTYERNNDHTVAGEDDLIMLFLPDTETETQTDAQSKRKVTLKTDTGWKTVNKPIKKPNDPQPMTQVMKENFINEVAKSKYEHLKCALFKLGIGAMQGRKRTDMKPAESEAANTDEKVKHRPEETQPGNTAEEENMSINQIIEAATEEPVLRSPPSHKMMKTEKTKTQHTEQTTTQTTARFEVSSLSSTEETPATTPSPDAVLHALKSKASVESARGESLSGLRMREDVPEQRATVHEGNGRDTTNRPGSGREGGRHEPGVSSFPFLEVSPTLNKHTAHNSATSTGDTVPLCRGLIHRTEAGWKHCMERSKTVGESVDAPEGTGEPEHEVTTPVRNHGDTQEYDHFYYFDGVLKRVQNTMNENRQSEGRSVSSVTKKEDTGENLLSYVHRLSLKNRARLFKRSDAD
ncbi:hypothetical protein JOB18_031102 [Solea senegalensis]|uniref:Uncharacterized protein n=1 Tax=Solea senegalensis TaxID=28829 RepID=A0AAV6R0U3_SOLSE|nr:hypothetical protein JOB18_031102 [Solea senegalensis]